MLANLSSNQGFMMKIKLIYRQVSEVINRVSDPLDSYLNKLTVKHHKESRASCMHAVVLSF